MIPFSKQGNFIFLMEKKKGDELFGLLFSPYPFLNVIVFVFRNWKLMIETPIFDLLFSTDLIY